MLQLIVFNRWCLISLLNASDTGCSRNRITLKTMKPGRSSTIIVVHAALFSLWRIVCSPEEQSEMSALRMEVTFLRRQVERYRANQAMATRHNAGAIAESGT